MGLDVRICFCAKKAFSVDRLPWHLPRAYELEPASDYHPAGATHAIYTADRYYGEGYARGNWPEICRALLTLLACQDIEAVWYGNDCCDDLELIDLAFITKMSAYWIKHGNRPYLDFFR